MKERIFAALTALALALGAAGCADKKQPSLPDTLIEPPGPDSDGGTGGGKGGKKPKVNHPEPKGDSQSDG